MQWRGCVWGLKERTNAAGSEGSSDRQRSSSVSLSNVQNSAKDEQGHVKEPPDVYYCISEFRESN